MLRLAGGRPRTLEDIARVSLRLAMSSTAPTAALSVLSMLAPSTAPVVLVALSVVAVVAAAGPPARSPPAVAALVLWFSQGRGRGVGRWGSSASRQCRGRVAVSQSSPVLGAVRCGWPSQLTARWMSPGCSCRRAGSGHIHLSRRDRRPRRTRRRRGGCAQRLLGTGNEFAPVGLSLWASITQSTRVVTHSLARIV